MDTLFLRWRLVIGRECYIERDTLARPWHGRTAGTSRLTCANSRISFSEALSYVELLVLVERGMGSLVGSVRVALGGSEQKVVKRARAPHSVLQYSVLKTTRLTVGSIQSTNLVVNST